MGLRRVNVPVEILIQIFSYLSSARDLYSCSLVCKKWKNVLDEEENSIWLQALERATPAGFRNSKLISRLAGSKAKLIAFENAWNGNDCSNNIRILENGLTLHRNPVAQCTDGIRGKCGYSRGLHYWTVIWHKPHFGSNATIGVATKREVLQRDGYIGLLGSTCESWGWDMPTRVLKYNGEEFAKYPQMDTAVSGYLSSA